MHVDRSTLSEVLERDTVRSATKLVLGAASLVSVLLLVALLPGIDRVVPETPVTFVALVGAIATVVMVGLLGYVAPKVATLTRLALAGPREVVENLSSIVFWLVVLAAVLVAHAGFAGVVTPFLGDAVWAYDVVFLALALPAVTFIAAHLYDSVDPSADLVADKVVDEDAPADAATDGRSDDSDTSTPNTDDVGDA